MLKEFKAFVMRGNVLDLAVAVILGAAFGKIVTSLVDDLLMPPLGLLLRGVDFRDLFIDLSGQHHPTLAAAKAAGAATLNYGVFLNTVVPTRRLTEACRDSAVSRFVLVSSFAVYDAASLPAGTLLDENCPLDPHPELRDPYTYSKVVQEFVAWEARNQSALPLVVIRPGVIYGPGRGAMSSRVGLSLGPVLLRIGGRRLLPYVYVDHCATALVRPSGQ